MLMTSENEVNSILSKFCSALGKVGKKRMLQTLNDLEASTNDQEDLKTFIVDSVCKEYNFDLSVLTNKQRLSDDSLDCRDTIVMLISTHTSIKPDVTAKIFNKGKQLVSQVKHKHIKRDSKIKFDRIYLEKYNALSQKIVDYKNNIN